MKIIYSDALIVGGGLAGLRSAIGCRQLGLKTIVLSLIPVKRSHSAACLLYTSDAADDCWSV